MKKRILLIDDSQFMREMCRDMLTSNGYEILLADNGRTGCEIYKEKHPDLVLLDIAMPEYDGMQVLKEIMAYDADANIVMLSAISHTQSILDSFESGARHFVAKPFEPTVLMDVVSQALAKKMPLLDSSLISELKQKFLQIDTPASPQKLIDLIVSEGMSGSGIANTLTQIFDAVDTEKKNDLSSELFEENPILLQQIAEKQDLIIELLKEIKEKLK